MKKSVIPTIEDWETVAKEILLAVPQTDAATVIALSGDLGVGKTTLVQAIAKVLGVTDPVTSPTFTIMKQYDTTDEVYHRLVHMDAYRLESVAELEPLQFAELLTTPNTIVCIEWAKNIAAVLPKDTTHIELGINHKQQHTIQSHL